MKAILKLFILERVLSNPNLKLKFTGGKTKILSGRFERKYKRELHQHFLRTVLKLITFLDAAKIENIMSTRLFNKNGLVRSSKSFLEMLCRDYLEGKGGNLVKHLAQVGVSVSFEQSHIEELDFRVSNLATDLRDGARLGKLAELLGSPRVLTRLRLPAVSRLQKVFNVGVSISSLSDLGVQGTDQIHPNYVVDGHRPQVLKLLWSVMTTFHLHTLLDKFELRNEIYKIYHRGVDNDENYTAMFSDICGKIEDCDDICDLLLTWVQAVVYTFGCKIDNFSAAFADGRVLCLIMNYYLPHIINFDQILPTELASGSADDPKHREQIVTNGRNNCRLARQKMLEIGGIPHMFPITDSFNPPDERSTIICVAYLCARLLESSKEIKAAMVIQAMFRNFRTRQYMVKSRLAVLEIEKFWICNKSQYFAKQRAKYLPAVHILEAFFIRNRHQIIIFKEERLAREKKKVCYAVLWLWARNIYPF